LTGYGTINLEKLSLKALDIQPSSPNPYLATGFN
jgi:hypothetical protein